MLWVMGVMENQAFHDNRASPSALPKPPVVWSVADRKGGPGMHPLPPRARTKYGLKWEKRNEAREVQDSYGQSPTASSAGEAIRPADVFSTLALVTSTTAAMM